MTPPSAASKRGSAGFPLPRRTAQRGSRCFGHPIPTGPFGRGGDRGVEVKVTFRGEFRRSFVAYLEDRARRLNVLIEVDFSPAQTAVTAKGPEGLVGALEMAACIAPEDCRVCDWKVEYVTAPAATGE